ncbi:signal peptide peptidase SppA [Mycobacterium sp. D16R24]|uniref:signal peptide peptidase SppA n=1 Tax=Mycobacterium sp. D16R24 TaxID=1855656 RepID=UPI0009947243|nr:signal peptide peptidase SppA [Mycobacterium sp. D16R24]
MFAFTTPSDVHDLLTKVDTARHRGVPRDCILELDLLEVPPEAVSFDPLGLVFSGASRPLSLRHTIAAIHRAIDDPRVAGLIARVQIPPAAAGAVQELRAAIEAFSAVKPSVAWAETYPGTLAYYLASAFGEVWMQPSGTVGLIGFAANGTFLRGALDKAGVEAQFLSRGQYKSAANLFTEDGYTEAQREADGRLLASLSEQVRDGVAASRKLEPADVDALADRAPLRRTDAVAAGLVDRIGYRDEAYARIAEVTGVKADKEPPLLYLARYARATRPQVPSLPGRPSRRTIGVVTLAGPIVSGRSGPRLFPPGPASGGDVIAEALRDAVADDSVAAIVLRVDSPGGSVNGSETIWREVIRAREAGKPVVASMGAVAGSGGYYVAMGADAIIANPGTITGSIGVITGKFITRGLKEKLGVASATLRTNANADAWSSNEPFTDEQRDLVEAEIDMHYDDFVQRVADGRNLTIDAVKAVAQGRIWSGKDALEHGLVDELGGFRDAVAKAKGLADIEADDEVRIASFPSSPLTSLLRQRASSQPAAAAVTDAVLGRVAQLALETVQRAQRSIGSAQTMMMGDYRF